MTPIEIFFLVVALLALAGFAWYKFVVNKVTGAVVDATINKPTPAGEPAPAVPETPPATV